MKNEELKKELLSLLAAFLASAVLFKIVYYKESTLVVVRMVASIFWLFTIPGMAVMHYWRGQLNTTARILMGTILGAAVMGTISYYLGLAGVNLKYHVVIPLAIIIAAGIFYFKRASSP